MKIWISTDLNQLELIQNGSCVCLHGKVKMGILGKGLLPIYYYVWLGMKSLQLQVACNLAKNQNTWLSFPFTCMNMTSHKLLCCQNCLRNVPAARLAMGILRQPHGKNGVEGSCLLLQQGHHLLVCTASRDGFGFYVVGISCLLLEGKIKLLTDTSAAHLKTSLLSPSPMQHRNKKWDLLNSNKTEADTILMQERYK